LVLRELFDDFELPKEFEPWLPRARTSPDPHTVTVMLSPATGTVSLYHRVKESLYCGSSQWKYPFESFDCEFGSEIAGGILADEVLTVSELRDLRPNWQTMRVGAELGSFPEATVHMKYSADWQFAVLSVFLPSFLILALVFFAQWKRRKVQVFVSLAAIMSMLIMLVSSRPLHSATLLDLWICGCFIHAVFLLVVDLTLPARRVRYALLLDVDDVGDRESTQTVIRLETKCPPFS
uniref:Neur_chan_LBD domain-containing protein n=1 Tax=Heligmosomoides polygyrus TaxID=6339 RepID=A0A183G5Q5_HELPZ